MTHLSNEEKKKGVGKVEHKMECSIKPSFQSSGAVWKSRWPSWAPVPNKPMVSVDIKQHSTNSTKLCHCMQWHWNRLHNSHTATHFWHSVLPVTSSTQLHTEWNINIWHSVKPHCTQTPNQCYSMWWEVHIAEVSLEHNESLLSGYC